MIDGAPENIIWCYGMYLPAYDEMRKSIPNIRFVKGVPGDMETLINPSIRNLVVIEDLMHELSNDQRITNLFTKGCHHRNLGDFCSPKHFSSRKRTERYELELSLRSGVQKPA